VRLSGKATARLGFFHDYKIYYSGDDKNYEYGVDVVVNRRRRVKNVIPQSNKIMLIQLQSAPFKLNIIQVYALTLDKADEEVEDFFTKK
jgi:hypothetical protein